MMQLVTLSQFVFLKLSAYSICFFFEQDTFTHILYHRSQRPGRPPLGPPLLPPLGGGSGGGAVPPTATSLAFSRCLAAPSSSLRASRVGIAALVYRQLARQPKRRRYGPGRRRRGRLCGLCGMLWRGLHRYYGFQPRPLVGRLAGLGPVDDVGHHLHGGHSGGVRGQVTFRPGTRRTITFFYSVLSL
jgi:hypothetical protein